jgi:hypothetical protein
VPAAVTATDSALEMVSLREYDVFVLVEIEIFHHCGSICQFVGNLRQRLKTSPAQAHRLQTICDERAESSVRYRDFFAPAESLVEMTFRHTALVVATTHRTLFGQAQALKMWWRFQICGTSTSSLLGNRQTKKRFSRTCGLVQQDLFKSSKNPP